LLSSARSANAAVAKKPNPIEDPMAIAVAAAKSGRKG